MTATGSGPVIRAGAGRATIDYPAGTWPLDGFGGQHDPLAVRTLVLQHDDERLALSVVDQTSLAPEPLAAVTEVLASTLDLAPYRILVCATHTFGAPHLAPTDDLADPTAARMSYARTAVLDAVRRSARRAARRMQPAVATGAVGTSHLNVNRDVETYDGWTIGVNHAGLVDRSLQVVRFSTAAGDEIAVLANYAVQPSVTRDWRAPEDGLARVTSDLAGAAMSQVERDLPGTTAFFLIGAAGDQAPTPVDARDPAAASVLLGSRLAADVLDTLGRAEPLQAGPIRLHRHSLAAAGNVPVERDVFAPTRNHAYRSSGARDLPYWTATLGSIAFIGTQVELSALSGIRLRQASPFPLSLVVTMVNGGAKYLPDAAAFDRMTYEALSSPYAQGTAERLERAILSDLNDQYLQQTASSNGALS